MLINLFIWVCTFPVSPHVWLVCSISHRYNLRWLAGNIVYCTHGTLQEAYNVPKLRQCAYVPGCTLTTHYRNVYRPSWHWEHTRSPDYVGPGLCLNVLKKAALTVHLLSSVTLITLPVQNKRILAMPRSWIFPLLWISNRDPTENLWQSVLLKKLYI